MLRSTLGIYTNFFYTQTSILMDLKTFTDPIAFNGKLVLMAEGHFITQSDRFQFVQANFAENELQAVLKGKTRLFGNIGFPFEHVETVLSSTHRCNFLHVLIKSPLNYHLLAYDECVFKKYPYTARLFLKMLKGGDVIVFKKRNEDVLFVKISNIYDGPPLLSMDL
jgi:hypothetical protein